MQSEPPIVDLIYEAALVPERWLDVLEALLPLSGSASAAMIIVEGDQLRGWQSTALTCDLAEDFLHDKGWLRPERQPARLLEATLPDHYFHSAAEVMTPAQLARDQHLLAMDRRGLGWQLGSAVQLPTGETLVFRFERVKAAGPHQPAELARLNALRPHLARAGLLASRLGMERARGALAALTALDLPAALLDSQGRLRECNALLTPALLDTRGGGRIALGSPGADALLLAALQGATTTRSFALPPQRDRPPCVAHVLPLSPVARDMFAGVVALLVLHVGASGPVAAPDVALLRVLFDLSAAESRLAAELATGCELAQAAARCGIQHSTARSYLERIFAKTGCHRQSELVAMLAPIVSIRAPSAG
ncbi:MAG: hypothetical protein ABI589_00230 [Burkholderiales bacterium]